MHKKPDETYKRGYELVRKCLSCGLCVREAEARYATGCERCYKGIEESSTFTGRLSDSRQKWIVQGYWDDEVDTPIPRDISTRDCILMAVYAVAVIMLWVLLFFRVI